MLTFMKKAHSNLIPKTTFFYCFLSRMKYEWLPSNM